MKLPTSFASRFGVMFSRTAPQLLFRVVLSVFTLLAILLTGSTGSAQTAAERKAAGPIVTAKSPGQVQDMTMISAGSGWVLASDRLFWTSDNGNSWADITPPGAHNIGSAYFYDKTHGWLISLPGTNGITQSPLRISSTSDGGGSWKTVPFDTTTLKDNPILGKGAHLYFSDPQHGWATVRDRTSTNFDSGFLIRTTDGGNTWSLLPTPPSAGALSFVDSLFGWLSGGPAGDKLWKTSDGGKTWTNSEAKLPGAQEQCRNTYGAPVFSDANIGVVTANAQCPDGAFLQLLETRDRGLTWKLKENESLSQVPFAGQAGVFPDGVHLVLLESGQDGQNFSRENSTAIVLNSNALPTGGRVIAVSFISPDAGWVLYTSRQCSSETANCENTQQLFSTSDGGITFKSILSASTRPQIDLGFDEEIRRGPSILPDAVAALRSRPDLIGTNSQIVQGEGFDTCVAPSISQMQSQWGQSYNTYGVYIGGTNYSCSTEQGNILSSGWTSSVATQGWGLIPIWVGYQASCVNTSGCAGNKCSEISTDLTTAASEGVTAADVAANAAGSYGMNNTIIYYDMEAYDTGDATCSASVTKFVNSWVEELHLDGYDAGIYGDPYNAGDWSSPTIMNQPDAAWFAAWNTYNDVANLPNSSSNEPVTYAAFQAWPVNMRLHQWCNSSLGGYPYTCPDQNAPSPISSILSINGQQGYDDDAVNGPVYSTSSTSQTLSVSLIANPAIGSAPLATTLTATIGGTAAGTVNYSFWWNCGDPGTSVSEVETTCGQLSASCASTATGFKCDGQTQTSYSVSNTYSFPQTYTAKVIAERGSAPPAENRLTITAMPVPTLTVQPLSSTVTTEQQLSVMVSVNPVVPYTTPTGNVTLTVGSSFTSQAAPLVSGSATINVPAGSLTAGTYTPRANYFGDSNYGSASGSAATSVTVTAATQTPTVSTGGSANVTSTGASVGGSVNPNGSDTKAWFQYATNNAFTGASTTTQQDLLSGTSNVAYNASLTGLSANTPYYFRAVASNVAGTINGATAFFTTSAAKTTPMVTVSPSQSSIPAGLSLNVTVTVAGSPTPTGLVTLLAGTGSFNGALVNGAATITVPAVALSVGSNSLFATYQGDSNYNIATGSSSVTVTAAAALTSPAPGGTLPAGPVTFTWTPGSGATGYALWAGTTGTGVGSDNLYYSGEQAPTVTSLTVNGLPTNGETIYIRLITYFGTTSAFTTYTYTSASGAVLTTPAPGSTLAGPSVTFSWTAGANATGYALWIGSSQGDADNLYYSGEKEPSVTSLTVSGLPVNGETIYVRLITYYGSASAYINYTYTAATAAVLTTPAPGSTLAGSSVTFNWSPAANATGYALWAGTTGTGAGSDNLYYSGEVASTVTSLMVSGLPVNGETIYVRLITYHGSASTFITYTLTSAAGGMLTTPAPGSTLAGPSVTFSWTAGANATGYALWIGSTQTDTDNLYYSGEKAPTVTSLTVNGLPTNGETIYVRLITYYGSSSSFINYTYTAD